ncbi:MAG: SDR family oxidoreductase [Ktedonobacteraceae bacterium]|nr:SDR family oxidoreductase [Ktedonobacteraceae bacterium]
MSEQIREFEQGLLQNQVAIVTGAAKGIGQGIALGMARESAVVVIADVDEAGSHVTENMIRLSGGTALTVFTDMSNEQHAQRLVDAALAQFGRIDILVNNVGIGVHTQGGILAMSREDGVKIVRTNLVEPLFLTQRVAREMIARNIHGSILFTSSIHARVTYLDPLYTATKAALEMLVRDVAVELADYGIRVNAVAPGSIATRGQTDRTYPFVPLGYKGTPTDVAHAMVFLASQKASYITGQTLTVDGGLSLAHEAYWNKKGFLKR